MKLNKLKKQIQEAIKLLKEESECDPNLNLGAGGANAGCPDAGGPGVYGTCVKDQYTWDDICVAIMTVGPNTGGGGTHTITNKVPNKGIPNTPSPKVKRPKRGRKNQKLQEQGPVGGYFCMNDSELSFPGYCVSQFPQNGTGGQSVYEAMQDAGMGVWAIYPTIEECIASTECSEHYDESSYPPPPPSPPGPFIGGNPLKGPQGPLAPNQNKKQSMNVQSMAPFTRGKGGMFKRRK